MQLKASNTIGMQPIMMLLMLMLMHCPTQSSALLAWGTCSPAACQDSPTTTNTIDENSPTDTAVVTLAATGGTPGYTFAITSATTSTSVDASAAFKIVGDNIEVDSPTLLDAETISYVDISVSATDSVSDVITRTLRIIISDVNDNDPVWSTFSPAFTDSTTAITSIDENTATATLFTAAATDSDSGVNGEVVYEIVSATFSDGSTTLTSRVTVDANSGAVSLTDATPVIDREAYTHFDVIVRARDNPTTGQRSVLRTVRIDIKDVNEDIPVFTPTSGQYAVTISETAAANSAVQVITVVDPDAAGTAVQCSIVSGNTPDRFQVRADYKTIELKTQIEPDSPTNDPVLYTLTLDCVDNNPEVYSGGKKTSTSTVNVTVSYNNDYSPQWGTFSPAWTSATAAVTTILENKPEDEVVFSASATDLDASDDGVVFYILDSAVAESGAAVTSAFKINSANGTVKIANSTILDRESYGYVDLTLKARDSPISGTTYTITRVVRVALSDYNEFRPVFNPASNSYTAYLTDETAANTAVQEISVIDPDYLNTTIACSISNGNSLNKFRFSATNTKLIETAAIVQPDKPESNPSIYILTVICADMNNGTLGTPVRTSTAYVFINMTLVNDNDPTVTLNGTAIEISEDTPVGSNIAAVTSDDLDVGIDGTYTLALDPVTPFQLTGDNSKIFISQALDRETTASYSLKVIATDKGSPVRSTTTILTITVTDANDNTPVCTPSIHSVTVSENTAATLLASIPCTDADTGDNKLLHYSFISGGTTDFTLIATNGELSTSPLDYDAGSPNKTLVIAVRDSATPASAQRTATVTVSVFVSNVNEGSPVWATFTPAWTSATTAITSVSESAEEGLVAFTAAATDADTGPDGRLVYSLASATASDGSTDLLAAFNISSDGKVAVKNSSFFDREAASPYTYVDIVVSVRDDPTTGTPNSIQRTVRVGISDFNEFDPRFTGEPYAATVPEDSAVGTAVQTLAVTDPDISATTILCEITSGNTDSVFRVNSADSKIIELNKAVNPDKPDNHDLLYSLVITCKDSNGGSGFRTATTSVNVTITTDNDNTPVVSLPDGASISVPETQALGKIANIIAYDNDYGTDGTIACSIAPTGTFGLTGCTELNLVAGLNYPTTNSYSLTISAIDSGATPKTGSVVVTVTVTDVNRHPPTCTPTSFTASVSETATPPSALTPATTVTCTDADGNDVYYQMETPTAPFTVNNLTGVVQLSGAVDYDSSTRSYSLRVKAIDPFDTSKTAVVTVTVSITAENEHTPTFSPTSATIEAQETLNSNAVVTTFAANDADYAPHAITAYSITAGNTGTMFSISNSGVVSIAATKTLDYEVVSGSSPYVLTIEATDGGGLKGTGTLTISVKDANDRAPVFTGTPYTASVNEGTAASSAVLTVAATDADSVTNNNNVIVYRKGTGDTSNYFSVNPTSGVISTTANILNYDTITSVTFSVLAIDGAGAGPHTTTAAVTITVVDVNNFAPSCTSFHHTINNIREDVTTPTQIFSFTSPSSICTDGDATDTLAFTMSGTAGDAKFAVASATGAVTVNGALDYETKTIHTFEIIVTDSAASPRSVTVTLTVNVLDVNEHQPTCTAPATANVNEGQAVGATVYSITGCSDTDTSSTSFTYSILSGTPFTVSATGVVATAAVLDYDPVAATTSYSVKVVVTDNAPNRDSLRSVTYTTVVTVDPVNEFPPVLSHSTVTADVAEDAGINTPLVLEHPAGVTVTLGATDADRGSNHATIRWEIVSGNAAGKFAIDANTGALETVGTLDREGTANYLLTVRAKDGPGLVSTTTCSVAITVYDVNDNSPVCNPTTQTITIYEAESAKQLVDFNAVGRVTDADTGVNANLGFTLNNAATLAGEFGVTGSALSTKRSFTASDPTSYLLEVVATDAGSPPLSSTCTVSVSIVRTARPPTFTVTDHTVTIAEDTAVTTEIFQFAGNLGVGGTAPLTMSVMAFTPTANSGLFAFNAADGKVTVNAALDYDATATRGPFILYVKLTDATPLTATGTLTVSLTDVNDNDPAFGSGVMFNQTIDENVGGGFVLQQVTWTDADSGNNGLVNCSIFNQTNPEIFNISASDCKLTAVGNPDREASDLHTIVVMLTDMGTPTRSVAQTFLITLSDRNDNTPAFGAASFTANLAEEAAAPQTVGTYAATDPDAGVNSQLIYSLRALDAATEVSRFSVSSAGVLTTTSELDRETVGTHRVLVVATDSGSPPRTGSATVVVTVTDVNDHTPLFTSVPYTARIAENAAAGTAVFTVTASDQDSTFGTISYSILSGNTNTGFAITATTGAVTVASPSTLNRETTPLYNLVVQAQDNGAPAKSATVTLTVTVLDVNEAPPTFPSPTVNFVIAENSPVNSIVGTVTATDSDVSQNIRFEVNDTLLGTAGHFDIESTTGRIFVKQAALDREAVSVYWLHIKAYDDGIPVLSSDPMLNVTIVITDTNDNDPRFGSANYSATVNENVTVGSVLLTVTASDADIGANAALTFSIEPSFTTAASLFAVNGGNGQLRVASALDFETSSKHEFAIVVKDGGTMPKRSATASVTISVVNVNEHRPVFGSSFYNCEVPYDDNSLAVIQTLSAIDADSGTFGSVQLRWNDTNTFLYLRSNSGYVIRNSDTAMEKNKTYIQYAVAEDGGGLVSVPVTVRCDSFVAEEYVILIHTDLSDTNFDLLEDSLTASLNSTLQSKHPGSSVKFWKKQWSGTRWVGYFYALRNTDTDLIQNINKPKQFVTKAELLTAWRANSDGTPSSALLTDTFTHYRIFKVEPYPDKVTSTPSNWYNTWWGILSLSLGGAVLTGLLGLLTFTLCSLASGTAAGSSAAGAGATSAAAGVTAVAPANAPGAGKAFGRTPMQQRHILPQKGAQKPPARFQGTPRPEFSREPNSSGNQQAQSKQSNADSGRGSANSDIFEF